MAMSPSVHPGMRCPTCLRVMPGRLLLGDGVELTAFDGRVLFGGRPVRLSPREYAVFAQLALRAGSAVPPDELTAAVWGPTQVEIESGPCRWTRNHVVKVTMTRLRQRLVAAGIPPDFVQTEPGRGWVMKPAPAARGARGAGRE